MATKMLVVPFYVTYGLELSLFASCKLAMLKIRLVSISTHL